ncbi:MAG: alkaline phosphatase [Chthoniobacterales bacterium]
MHSLITTVLSLLLVVSAPAASVIFLHPDGAGISHWQAARMTMAGPDGEINWDRLPSIAIYRGHLSDTLTGTSNGGATVHAYGVKVPRAGFGSDGTSSKPPISAGGQPLSLMQEAAAAGIRVGVVNSGSVIEPGTAVFLSSVEKRAEHAEITRQIVESGADVILSGGEEWFLPLGQSGHHGDGAREDNRDLIARARELGYTVVFTRDELATVPPDTRKLLGIFSTGHTFNDLSEEELAAADRPLYQPDAPTLAEMTAKALEIFSNDPFFLVVEEEGSDNFGNNNNAVGTLEALRRTDETIGLALDFIDRHPETLLITAADSEAGGMDVIGIANDEEATAVAANGRDRNGAPYDLAADGKPFLSAPDAAGIRHPFVISWSSFNDTSGGIVVRAAGHNSDQVSGSFDNTDVYRVMRKTLFESPPSTNE